MGVIRDAVRWAPEPKAFARFGGGHAHFPFTPEHVIVTGAAFAGWVGMLTGCKGR